jgi:hypothetical protein
MPCGQPHAINRTTLIEHNGKVATVGEHADEHGQPLVSVLQRLRGGWSAAKAFGYGKPVTATTHFVLTADDIATAALNGVTLKALQKRLLRGIPLAEAISVPARKQSAKAKAARVQNRQRMEDVLVRAVRNSLAREQARMESSK